MFKSLEEFESKVLPQIKKNIEHEIKFLSDNEDIIQDNFKFDEEDMGNLVIKFSWKVQLMYPVVNEEEKLE